ncbi:MAG: amidohydrolase family protein [Ilumatobacteraceae bacterium]
MADGTLAGSVLTLDRAVRNLVAFTGCALAEAVAAATSVPSRLLGRSDLGSLAVGVCADLVLLDEDLTVAATVIAGRLVVDRDGRFTAA